MFPILPGYGTKAFGLVWAPCFVRCLDYYLFCFLERRTWRDQQRSVHGNTRVRFGLVLDNFVASLLFFSSLPSAGFSGTDWVQKVLVEAWSIYHPSHCLCNDLPDSLVSPSRIDIQCRDRTTGSWLACMNNVISLSLDRVHRKAVR